MIGKTLVQMKRITNHDKGCPTYNYHANFVCVDSCDNKLVSFMGTSLTSKLKSLVREYKDVFVWSYDDLDTYDTKLINHTSPLNKDESPFK